MLFICLYCCAPWQSCILCMSKTSVSVDRSQRRRRKTYQSMIIYQLKLCYDVYGNFAQFCFMQSTFWCGYFVWRTLSVGKYYLNVIPFWRDTFWRDKFRVTHEIKRNSGSCQSGKRRLYLPENIPLLCRDIERAIPRLQSLWNMIMKSKEKSTIGSSIDWSIW